jgi:hypothetical protein
MIIYHGISLVLLAVVIFAIGMFKPKWILFWMDNPNRLIVTAVAMALFMIGAVLFGKGNQEKLAAKKQPTVVISDKPVIEAEPKPVVKPAPAPAQAPGTSANDLRP